MTDVHDTRNALEARLAELSERAGRIEADLAKPLSPDSTERAVERESDDALEVQDALIVGEITAIRAALSRIDQGVYGECTRCGNAVGDRRLAAMPEAALCIDCAQIVETQ